MGGGASKRGPIPSDPASTVTAAAASLVEAKEVPQAIAAPTTHNSQPNNVDAAVVAPLTPRALGGQQTGPASQDFGYDDDEDGPLEEVSDEEGEFDPRVQGLDDANRHSWEMISNSLGMDDDDLLFNMLYFGGGTQSVGLAINSAMEETVAAHSEHNTPYKLQPASHEDVQGLATQSYGDILSPRSGPSGGWTRECSVCREELEPTCPIIKLPRCSHIFHDDCLKKWLTLQNWCPVCRTEIGGGVGGTRNAAANAMCSPRDCSPCTPAGDAKLSVLGSPNLLCGKGGAVLQRKDSEERKDP